MSFATFRRTKNNKKKRPTVSKRLDIEILEGRLLPSSIWGSSVIPATPAVNDSNAVELGVKFRSDVAGYITGLEFYKGAGNIGTHVGDLWTKSGSLLASAKFTGETATGWQSVSFATPVAIAANTSYVASYFAASGHYAYNGGYFATAGVDNAPLHALADGVDGHNGIYHYGASGGFPTSSNNSANYWVDVVFNTTPSDPTLPTAIPGQPAPNATGVDPASSVTAVFNKSVVASSIVFTLNDPNNNAVPASITYDDSTHTATLIPNVLLSNLTTYTATLSAAQDTSGNQLAAPLQWSFTTGDPALVGQWSQVINWPLVAINVVLLDNGKVLMWDGGGDCIGSSSATIWDPTTAMFTPVPLVVSHVDNDIFCSGLVSLSDGRILVFGGHVCLGTGVGTAFANIFDPRTQQWTAAPTMTYPRWYPTGTTLGDGQVLVTSGADATNTSFIRVPEIYDPATNTWTALTQAGLYVPSYPFIFQLPDGRILEAGSGEFDSAVGAITPTQVLDLKTQTWTTVDPNPVSGSSAVMYLPGKVMESGSPYNAISGSSNPASPATYVLDMTQPSPKWQQTPPMAVGRSYDTLTILPTGTVLATGGSTIQDPVNLAYAVKSAASWDPTTQTWTTLASEQIPRIYHSTALLLPDGRVLVAGGGRDFGKEQANETNAEIYSPSYLFKGPRPTITAAPASTPYASSFVVQTPDAATITSVALVRNGAMTHALNMDQRYVPLSFQQTAGGLVVQAPVDGNTAPPGYYMLFLINSKGVPSVASFIQLTSPQVTATTPSIGAKGVGIGTNVTVTFSGPMNSTTITSSTVQLLDASGKSVPATISYNSIINTATLTPNQPLAGSTTYTILARGNAGGAQVKDIFGNPLSADYTATFQTTTLVGSNTYSLFASTTTPSVTSVNDSRAVELGVQFRSDVNGYITGIRFYKGAGNTGTHIGNLWTSTGQLLATATFTSETASGWQQVNFSSPVAITANTTYVASYYAPAGHYAADLQYLTSRVDSGPLHALANFVDANNGVYFYGADAFPSSHNGNASNYWVDVVMTYPAVPATHLSVLAPAGATAGSAFGITITALDANNNIALGYTGTVHFTSTDGAAVVPADYTFTAVDAGVHVFSNGVTLKTAGVQSITAGDKTTGSILGSASIPVAPAAASSLQVSGFPSPTTAGVAHGFTVTAQDVFGNTATGYMGTITFTSTDAQSVLPANYAFTGADAGAHTFTATLKTAGNQTLAAKDMATTSISGSESGITVNPAAANSLIVTGFPSSTTAGFSQTFNVTAQDPYSNTATGYSGTITFASTDAQGVLPANYTFTSADGGAHTFSATLKTAGTQALTASDTVATSISGSQSGILVNAAAASSLQVGGFPSPTPAGGAQNFTVTAQDIFGNTATGYSGTIAFASTDPQAVLPANYTFTSADAGAHTFAAALKTTGSQALTAQDTAAAGISANQSAILVNSAAASQFVVSGFPQSVISGTAGNFTVSAFDAYGNPATAYTGTVRFTSSDGQAILPANYTFTSADGGAHAFTATLMMPGLQSVSAADTGNAAITGTESGIIVMTVPPTASLSGSSSGVPGQSLTFALGASEPGLVTGTVYTYRVQWGDGSSLQTLSGSSGTQVSHVFTTTGTNTVSLTATDPSGNASVPATLSVALSTVLMETDPFNSSQTALYMGGTVGNDTIAITPVVNNGVNNGVKVAMNFVSYGSFVPTGHVVVYGQSGNDIIKTAPMTINGVLTYVNVPLLIFAGNGNDTLNVLGSMAGNVVVGGAGSDNLYGGLGRDILIGGSGSSTLRAGSGGDILIGGTTDFDNNAAALAAVLAEWGRTDVDYATRIAHLNGSMSGGLNGSVLLNPSTVHADGMANSLFGGAGMDWYFAGVMDAVVNRASGEVVTQV